MINDGEGVEKRKPSYTVGGYVNWYNQYGEQSEVSLKKLKIELPYDQLSHSWTYIWRKPYFEKIYAP